MSEMLMGGDVTETPTSTPTERLIWVALWHHGTYYGIRLWGSDLRRHVGGSQRSLDAALRSLIKRGIVEAGLLATVTGASSRRTTPSRKSASDCCSSFRAHESRLSPSGASRSRSLRL